MKRLSSPLYRPGFSVTTGACVALLLMLWAAPVRAQEEEPDAGAEAGEAEDAEAAGSEEDDGVTGAEEEGAEGEPDHDAVERALVLFQAAELRYEEGRFEEAAELLMEARGIHDEPLLSYNLGRAYEELGRYDEAAEEYRRYLDAAPDASNRGAVEARLARLTDGDVPGEEGAEEQEGESTEEDAEPPREQPVSPGRDSLSAWPFVALSLSGAALGMALGFGAASQGRREAAGEATTHADAVERLERAQDFADAANALFVASGVFALMSVTLLVIDLAVDFTPPEGAPDQASLRVGLGLAGVVAEGRF